MAQAIASMAGLRGSTQAVFEGPLQLGSSSHFTRAASSRLAVSRSVIHTTVRAQQVPTENEAVAQSSRRVVLGLVAAGLATGSLVKSAFAVKSIKVGPPPPPSGGLPGTLNSDEARDLDLPLKDRFFIQKLTPVEAAKRVKDSAKDIVSVKKLIEKKQWPYVQMDLRNQAGYLRYDLNTVIAAKPKEEKKPLRELTGKLLANIASLDHAAKIKSTPEAEKYYGETVASLNDLLSKLG